MKVLLVILVICRFLNTAWGRPYKDASTQPPLEILPDSDMLYSFGDLVYTEIIPIDSYTFKDHQRRAQGPIANLNGQPQPIQSRKINRKTTEPNNCKFHSNGTCEEDTTRGPPYKRTVYPENKYRNKYFCKSASEKPSVTKQMDRLLGRTRPPCHENEGTKAYSQSTTKKQSNQITSSVSEVTETVIEDYPFTDQKYGTSTDSSDMNVVYSTTATGKLSSTETLNTSVESHNSVNNKITTATVTTEKLILNASLSTEIISTTGAAITAEINATEETAPLTITTVELMTSAILNEQTVVEKYKENTGRKHLNDSSVPTNSSIKNYEDLIVTLKHYHNDSRGSEITHVEIRNTNNSNVERIIVLVPTNAVLGNQSSSREENIETTNTLKITKNKEKLITETNKLSTSQNFTGKDTNEDAEAYTEKTKQGPLQSAESSNLKTAEQPQTIALGKPTSVEKSR